LLCEPLGGGYIVALVSGINRDAPIQTAVHCSSLDFVLHSSLERSGCTGAKVMPSESLGRAMALWVELLRPSNVAHSIRGAVALLS
jgi:hypothetical protein